MAGKGQAEGCAACAKWLLIIFNILFCLLGIGILAAGIYAYVALRDYFNILGNANLNVVAILGIVFGVITFLIATLGCVGACKESPCMLFSFAAIIGVLLLAQIISGAVAFAYKDEVEELVERFGPDAISKAANSNQSEAEMEAWDLFQSKLKCCGFNDAADWNGKIPQSCYAEPDMESSIYPDGCKDKIKEFLINNIKLVGGIFIGFAVIELMGIVFACCVGCAARKGEYA